MRKALTAVIVIVVVIIAALTVAVMPRSIGKAAATLTALTGTTHFIDGESSAMDNLYPGTSCHIYAPGQTFTVTDIISSFWSGWQEDFARGFNRQLQERWPQTIKTECGRPNPNYKEVDDSGMIDNLEVVDNSTN